MELQVQPCSRKDSALTGPAMQGIIVIHFSPVGSLASRLLFLQPHLKHLKVKTFPSKGLVRNSHDFRDRKAILPSKYRHYPYYLAGRCSRSPVRVPFL